MAATQPPKKLTLRSIMRSRYATIREFAAALVQLVHHVDDDGREIGYSYDYIHAAILRKFPTVTVGGPHKGRPTKMPYKELVQISCDLNKCGVRLPFRPRAKAKKNRQP